MKIQRLRIQNFRSFEDVTIDFPELTTSLVGMNGSGKTTILDSLNILMSLYNPESKVSVDDFCDSSKPIKIAAEFDGFYFIEFEDGWNKKTLPAKILLLTISHRSASGQKVFNSQYTSSYSMIPQVYDDATTLGLQAAEVATTPSRVYKSGENYKFSRKSDGEGSIGALQLSSVNHAIGLPSTFYYDGTREKELKHGFSTLWSKLVDELDWRYFKKYLEMDEAAKNSFLDTTKATKTTIDTTTTGSRRKDIIGELIKQTKELLGEKYADLEIAYLNPERPHKRSELALHWPDKIISLDKMGAGERAVLAFVLSVIVAKHSKNPIILLVDEMETHLHPQLMVGLREYLEKEGVQIIYTTHSENLIDLGRWKSIKRLGDGKIFPEESTLDQDVEGKKIHEHLDDISTYYLDKTILKKEDAQILFGNKALLVEGPNDKYCLPVASAKIGKDISDVATILATNGKTNMPHYQVICVAFGIDHFAVYDKDNASDSGEVTKNNRITSLTVHNFGFDPSFESVMTKHKMAEIMSEIENNNIPQQVKDCVEAVYTWKEQQ